MRKLRLLAAALLCLTLTAPALAVGAEQEEAAPWEQVVEWVKGWIGGVPVVKSPSHRQSLKAPTPTKRSEVPKSSRTARPSAH